MYVSIHVMMENIGKSSDLSTASVCDMLPQLGIILESVGVNLRSSPGFALDKF